MGIVGIPKTWATDDVLTAVDLNLINSTLYNEFNGNIDNTNIKVGANIDAAKLLNASILAAKLADGSVTNAKLDYTSVEVLRVKITGGANGKRIATGLKTGQVLVAGNKSNIVVTFSTDADDGNPTFANATIRVTCTVVGPGGSTDRYYATVENITQTSFTVHVLSSNAGSTDTVAISWIA